MQQQQNLDCGSKVVRISNSNFEIIIAQAKFGMTFNDALSKVLEQNNLSIGSGKSLKKN